MVIIYLVEVINLWNLSNISGDVSELMFDFIALGIVAEFDDYFIAIYKSTSLEPLINDIDLTFDRTKSPKRRLPVFTEIKRIKLEKLMQKIRESLKELKTILGAENTSNKPNVDNETS